MMSPYSGPRASSERSDRLMDRRQATPCCPTQRTITRLRAGAALAQPWCADAERLVCREGAWPALAPGPFAVRAVAKIPPAGMAVGGLRVPMPRVSKTRSKSAEEGSSKRASKCSKGSRPPKNSSNSDQASSISLEELDAALLAKVAGAPRTTACPGPLAGGGGGRPLARRGAAEARSYSARRWGSTRTLYASAARLNIVSARARSAGFLSGCQRRAAFLYALRTSASLADFGSPRTS
mmetsp:Transcript_92728/g.286285  ORF Transcript_92728/g.286285 Transcript_92728/m.286285 type:complete len:238 (+) Transcript_92728:616-1329(+)